MELSIDIITYLKDTLQKPMFRTVLCEQLNKDFGLSEKEVTALLNVPIQSGHIKRAGKHMLVWNPLSQKPICGGIMKNVIYREATTVKLDLPKSQWWGPYPRIP